MRITQKSGNSIIAAIFLCILMLASANYNASAQKLVGLWMFDEGKGNVVKDASGNGNDGEVKGAKWVNGKYGKALKFDGATEYVEIPDSDTLDLETFTLMAWFNIEKLHGKWHIIASKENRGPTGRNYGMFGNINSGVIHYSFTVGNAWRSYNAVTNVVDGKWHHAAITYDKKTFIAYVDGKPDAQQNLSEKPDQHDNSLWIGGCPIGNYWLLGMVDEVAVYDNALSEAKINNLMKGHKVAVVNPADKAATTWANIKEKY